MTTPGKQRPRRARAGNAIAWRLACFRLSASVLRIDIALLPGLGSILL